MTKVAQWTQVKIGIFFFFYYYSRFSNKKTFSSHNQNGFTIYGCWHICLDRANNFFCNLRIGMWINRFFICLPLLLSSFNFLNWGGWNGHFKIWSNWARIYIDVRSYKQFSVNLNVTFLEEEKILKNSPSQYIWWPKIGIQPICVSQYNHCVCVCASLRSETRYFVWMYFIQHTVILF